MRLPPLLALLLVAGAMPAVGRGQEGEGGAADARPALDSARVRQLYVSNRPEDHPVANYAAAITRKARTDSIFAARSVGVMRFARVRYRSSVDGFEVPAYLFAPLTP
ncbi:MAG: hypothetical protein MUE41_12645, partial [Gemmatimonadaceae bacterium]|nr:hypothetical protein [Gemmatimonadaceae bacterium]